MRGYRAYAISTLLTLALASCTPTHSDFIIPAPTTAVFTIAVPASSSTSSARRPRFISPSTQSIVITLVSADGSNATGTPVASNLAASNPQCAGSPLTCTVSVPAIAGSDVFSVVTYDAPQTSGSPATPVGNVLSRANTTVAVAGHLPSSVPTPLALDGVVDHVAITLSGSVVQGTPSTVAVTVDAFDRQDNLIVGPGNFVDANGDPLTLVLTDSDISGATTFAPSTFIAPSTGATLTYNGAAITSPTISVNVTGGSIAGNTTGARLTVSPAGPTLAQLSNATWLVGTSVTETLTGTNFISGATTVTVSGGVTVSNVNVTSPTSLTADFAIPAGATIGVDNVTVTTAGGTSAAQTFTVANGSIVTLATDTNAGTPAGSGAGTAGDLRSAILNSNAGNVIIFNCGSPCTITLNGPLPPITHDVTIDGGTFGNVVIDGNSAFRALWADSGNVTLHALQIQNVLAQGGAGGSGFTVGAGGGLGAGAGLFIRTANVRLNAVFITGASATGGAGGAGLTESMAGGGGAGGGGMGGNGGNGSPLVGGANPGAGGGGGGVLGNGADAVGMSGGNGGSGGGGGGGGVMNVSGSGGLGYGAAAAGGSGSSSVAGTGGFGGGGGGGADGSFAGAGGFGGGGGASGSSFSNSAAGGAGGGGSGEGGNGPIAGGILTSAVHGGAGGNGNGFVTVSAGGGGGAAAGPAVFLFAGSLTTINSGASQVAATGGAAGTGTSAQVAQAGTADATPVFNFGGTVNGSSIVGPIGSALPNQIPSLSSRFVKRTRQLTHR